MIDFERKKAKIILCVPKKNAKKYFTYQSLFELYLQRKFIITWKCGYFYDIHAIE